MMKNYNFCLGLNVFIFSIFCIYAVLMNVWFYHYNNRALVITDMIFIIVVPYLIAYGLKIYFEYEVQSARCFKEFSIGLSYFILLSLGAYCIEYTPFSPIDQYLLQWDKLFLIHVQDYVYYLKIHSTLKSIFIYFYYGLGIELFIIPMYVLIRRRFALVYEYYNLIFITAIMGYVIYYFFPTVAPATAIGGEDFLLEQYATGIKFNELHQHLVPSTTDGGLIAFPSFHVIWAVLLTYMVRFSPILFVMLLIYNIGLVISCVVLGWHYGVDVIGSMVVLGLAYQLHKVMLYETGYQFRRKY